MRIHFPAIAMAFIAITLLTPSSLHATLHNGILSAPVRLSTLDPAPAVRLALKDLAGDFERTFENRSLVLLGKEGDVVVQIDSSLGKPESWTIRITESKVFISGADELGAIYGIYEFSKRFLDVDPLWFWQDQKLPKRAALPLVPQTLHSKQAAFHFRGWFINDEDLLCEWKTASGKRHIDYPYYNQVMSLDVVDRIFEALLRSGGNLIIPGSFINVMNPPEAALVKRAVQRGLYVTQHHIEPLGVSYVGFQNYWQERGQTAKFSYGADPDQVRKTWQAYAAKWHELGGDHVVWQLGLRGNGDRPVWASDPNIKESDAGAIISRAIADQWKTIHTVDPRPQPPATITLWAEGSELMQKGTLTIPQGITLVFSDVGATQMLQGDFDNTPRSREHSYGVYYHLGFWVHGPHLVQGTVPERMKSTFDSVLAKGDTNYAILNVSNIRPFTLGINAAMEVMQEGTAWKEQEFFSPIVTPALQRLYRELFASLVALPDGRLLQDGTCQWMIKQRLTDIENNKNLANTQPHSGTDGEDSELTKRLDASIIRLRQVVEQYPPENEIPTERRSLYDYNLRNQASMLVYYYACLRDLLQRSQNDNHLHVAGDEIESLLTVRQAEANGRWEDWYRGDKKENIPELLQRIRHDEAAF